MILNSDGTETICSSTGATKRYSISACGYDSSMCVPVSKRSYEEHQPKKPQVDEESARECDLIKDIYELSDQRGLLQIRRQHKNAVGSLFFSRLFLIQVREYDW